MMLSSISAVCTGVDFMKGLRQSSLRLSNWNKSEHSVSAKFWSQMVFTERVAAETKLVKYQKWIFLVM